MIDTRMELHSTEREAQKRKQPGPLPSPGEWNLPAVWQRQLHCRLTELPKDLRNQLTAKLGQLLVSSGVEIRQFIVIKSQQVHQSDVHVANWMHNVNRF